MGSDVSSKCCYPGKDLLAVKLSACAFCSHVTKMLCLKDSRVANVVPQPGLL